MEMYLATWKKALEFSGRSRRKEFWTFAGINFGIALGLGFVDGLLGLGFLSPLFYLATLVPNVAVGIRRLHDIGKTGWFMLLGLVPIVNLVLLYFCVLDSQAGNNQYGPNPKQNESSAAKAAPAA